MSTVTYRLKSAKLRKIKSGQTLDVSFDEINTTDGGEVIIVGVVREGSKEVHPDLLATLQALVPHLLVISETIPGKEFKNAGDNKTHAVYGVHMKEANEQRQVVLLGRKTVSNGRGYNIPLWPVSLDEEAENAYHYVSELLIAVDAYLNECELYLSGKYKPSPQTSMQDDLDNTITHPASESAKAKDEAKDNAFTKADTKTEATPAAKKKTTEKVAANA